MNELTEDEIIDLGTFCETLLMNDHWERLVSIFENQQWFMFTASDPKAKNEREYIHAKFAGFREFQSNLVDLVAQKRSIEEKHSTPSSDEDDV